MRFSATIFVITLLSAATLPAFAQQRDDPGNCLNSDDANAKFAACDRLLATGVGSAESRSAAYVERGLALVRLESYGAAVSDYDEAVRLNPRSTRAYYLRALLNRYLDRFEQARADFEQVIALTESAPATGDPAQRAAFITEMREYSTEMRSDAEMETYWANYLTEIQNQGDYPNWSSPPRDLYNQRISAPLSQARPSGRQAGRSLIGTFTFRCRNQTVMRITFDPGDRTATIRQFGRPPVTLRQSPAPMGFRYARQSLYELTGTGSEVRWIVGGGQSLVCDRGLW
jgi:hypothetical protein